MTDTCVAVFTKTFAGIVMIPASRLSEIIFFLIAISQNVLADRKLDGTTIDAFPDSDIL